VGVGGRNVKGGKEGLELYGEGADNGRGVKDTACQKRCTLPPLRCLQIITNIANNGPPLSLVLQRRPSNPIMSPSFGRHTSFPDANNDFSCAIGRAHARNLRAEYANCYVRAEDETRGSHADKARWNHVPGIQDVAGTLAYIRGERNKHHH
jgi:hypothetical protein